jgi:hypothetical protein
MNENDTVLQILQHAAKNNNIILDDDVVTDTIDDFGAENVTHVVMQTQQEMDPFLEKLLDKSFEEFFRVALEKQKSRQAWTRMLDPADAFDIVVNLDGSLGEINT